jgi:predicted metal-dependent phosphoesterase TrpH
MSIDLHIHSLFSDGTHTPAEIVKIAKQRGLSAISITDHDTLSGTDEAIVAGEEYGIEVVSGIELSVYHNDIEMHILGYLLDHSDKKITKRIIKLQTARNERNKKIVEKLNCLGIAIRHNEVKAVSKIGQTGRPHIAKVLHKKGLVRTFNDAFEKYLRKGAPAYVPRFVYSAEEAINMIKDAGGFAVLAHPVQVDNTFTTLQKIIDELVALGLDGVELYYPTHSGKIRKRIRKITQKHDLLFTGGSDYHGDIRPGTSLAGGVNVHVPAELLEKMKQKWILL